MDELLKQKIREAKELLNNNGYLVLRLGKGQIKIANECIIDHYVCDHINCNDCVNRTCLKGIIKEQII